MINIKEVCDNLNISYKKIRYYMFTNEINYEYVNNNFFISETDYELLKKIVVLRRLGLSFEDIDNIKVNKNMKKYLVKMDNLIPEGNKYENIKKVIAIMLKDNATFMNMDNDKYLELIKKLMMEGKIFYDFNEDITYEDYKSLKFHREYILMISLLTLVFFIGTLIGGGFSSFITYFPYYFIGLMLTFIIFYIPIRLKYYRRIMNLLKNSIDEKE